MKVKKYLVLRPDQVFKAFGIGQFVLGELTNLDGAFNLGVSPNLFKLDLVLGAHPEGVVVTSPLDGAIDELATILADMGISPVRTG